MRIASVVVAGSIAACALAGCGSVAMSSSTASTASVSVERGVRFVDVTLAWGNAGPANPGGPHMKLSGALVSGAGVVIAAGTIKVYVLDGSPGRATHAIATIGVHDGIFATSFTIIGPGGNVLRLDYVANSKVLASTVIKG